MDRKPDPASPSSPPAAEAAPAEPRGPRVAPLAQAVSARERTLVVDDEPATLRYVRDLLAKAGFGSIATTDHDEVLGLVETERPSLVLMDPILPEPHGIVLMKRIPGIAQVPVISSIKRLRRTLGGDAKRPKYISSAPGVGYRFAEDREPGQQTP